MWMKVMDNIPVSQSDETFQEILENCGESAFISEENRNKGHILKGTKII